MTTTSNSNKIIPAGNELIDNIYKALSDKKATNIRILDISNLSIIADTMVICSGSNINQLHAIADNVEYTLGLNNIHYNHVEGYQGAEWILMDYGNFAVNIFDEKARSFYDLDHIWHDGKVITP